MTYQALARDIELYLHIQGSKTRALIKSFINEAILDFLRTKEWRKAKAAYDLTLDGSNSYDLSTLVPDFEGEIMLLDSSGTEYQKNEYETYLQYTTKTYLYSILGTTLYVEGTSGTLTLMYISRGDPYPLVADADESVVLVHYWDIVKQFVIVKMLGHLGDPMIEQEKQALVDKLTLLRTSENRFANNGKTKVVQR